MLEGFSQEQIFFMLRALNRQVLRDFMRLKYEFIQKQKQLLNNQISNTLKGWKPILEETVNKCFQKVIIKHSQKCPKQIFSFKSLVKQLTHLYGQNQEYIEIFKCLCSSIEMIKFFMKQKAYKDPTTFIYEQQLHQLINPNNI